MPADNSPEKPVFFDPTRRRAVYLSRTAATAGLFVAAALTIFCASVVTVPVSHRVRLRTPRFLPDNALRAAATLDAAHRGKRPGDSGQQAGDSKRKRTTPQIDRQADYGGMSSPGQAAGVVGGFFVNWDEVSLASLRQHSGEMTHLFPGWMHLNENGGGMVITDSDPSDKEALKIAQERRLIIVPLLNNFSAERNDFDEARLHDLLISPAKRRAMVTQIHDYLTRHKYAGINIDLETEDEGDRALLPGFTAQIAASLRPAGLLVTQDIQEGDATQNAAIARSCNFVIPMIYDLHYAEGDAGPIAPQDWAQKQLDELLKTIPPQKIALAIGNYAYNWEQGRTGAQTLTFGEAMATARESLDASEPPVRLDADAKNPHFSYEEEDGKRHDVWLLDAVTAYNFQRYAEKRGVKGRALWYLGSEDPTLWTFFGRGKTAGDAAPLANVHYGFEIDFEGEGEALEIVARPQEGKRSLTMATDGMIADEKFLAYPSTYIVRRSGWKRDAQGRLEKRIALTFDDGPDPQWTPGVLNALKTAGVPATFFVIGQNAERYPELIRQEWDEGHEIGNHSFYHPNLAQVGVTRANLEIDATQRAIQAVIGRSTTLFRPPYGVDVEPSTSDELMPIEEAEKLGYITIAEGIDPQDWNLGNHPTASQIADRIVQAANEGQGNVVLLHDSGGNRAATIAAIPLVVARLKAQGYSFVPVAALVGAANREALFPPVRGREAWVAFVDRQVFGVSRWTEIIVTSLFVFTLIGGTVRLTAVALLALQHRRNEKARDNPHAASGSGETPFYSPFVSVVIAAYNEEKVIARTIRALLDGGYPKLEVIVVDDGSKDDTAGIVAREFGGETRVRLIVKENGGKASALNSGIAQAGGEVLIGLDADTLFAPDTVHRLAGHFADATVGAVAGNIEVGNRGNLLTRWQAVEYVTSQNFDRRAYDVLNAIPVVPGCVGAWRTAAVREAGGYETNTLAEDADLTWRVCRLGWRILSDPSARAYTEAPEKWRDLLKQRFRWTFGTLQTLWKHRDLLFRPRYGWFGCLVVPSLWIFQIALPLALPFADVGLIFAAFAGQWQAALAYFAFFFCAEYAAASLAYRLDHAPRERRRDLRYLFLQRLVWRYLLFWILVRALVAAITGARSGWNKLERRGTAVVGKA